MDGAIIVDAKTPLDAFLNASACEDEVQRLVYMKAPCGAGEKAFGCTVWEGVLEAVSGVAGLCGVFFAE